MSRTVVDNILLTGAFQAFFLIALIIKNAISNGIIRKVFNLREAYCSVRKV
jgi:hypothetical protein